MAGVNEGLEPERERARVAGVMFPRTPHLVWLGKNKLMAAAEAKERLEQPMSVEERTVVRIEED
jgi:hypothetical protein